MNSANIDDKGGNISNFRNAGKSSNKEFIFYKKYDYDLARGGINLVHSVLSGYVTNMSAQFGESFLCRNGLPIRISYTGNMADAQNNPQFLGYETFVGEFRNRDYRFIGCCNSIPDRISYAAQNPGRERVDAILPYPTPVFPKNNEIFDSTDPVYSSACAVFHPTIRNNSTMGTYSSRKFLIEGANRPVNTESADFPLIRLAEVYLIYAEATCELNNGP